VTKRFQPRTRAPREETRTTVLDEAPVTLETLLTLLQDPTQPLERQVLAASALLDLTAGFLRPPS
jgi:hypothetical protein